MIDRLSPPICGRARFIVALVMLAVGIPRLFAALPVNPLALFPSTTYGWVLVPLGIALAITAYRWRLTPFGRSIAVAGFAAWVTLAFATSSVTSILIDIIMAGVLFLEIVARHDC